MLLTSSSRAGMLALFALTTLFTAPAGAKDGRDFSGHYSLTNVIDKGGQVELTLTLQVFNYSGADLKQSVITLRPSPPVPGVLANFAPIKLWRSGSDVVVSQQVTIGHDDYQRWSARTQPAVFVEYSGADGHAHLQSAQVRRLPIIQKAISEGLETRPPAAK